jgi:hypothetical protein
MAEIERAQAVKNTLVGENEGELGEQIEIEDVTLHR